MSETSLQNVNDFWPVGQVGVEIVVATRSTHLSWLFCLKARQRDVLMLPKTEVSVTGVV